MVEHTARGLSKVTEYNAEYAQNDANSKNSAKGPPIKLGRDWALVNAVSRLIKEEKYSPYVVLGHFERTRWPGDTRLCEKTLYNYIAAGDISDVTQKDLLYGGKRFKPKGKPKKHSRAMNATRSIDKRLQEANERKVVGHWEMDTVYSDVPHFPEQSRRSFFLPAKPGVQFLLSLNHSISYAFDVLLLMPIIQHQSSFRAVSLYGSTLNYRP